MRAKDPMPEVLRRAQFTCGCRWLLLYCSEEGLSRLQRAGSSWPQMLLPRRVEAASGVLCLVQRIHPWVMMAVLTLGTLVSFEPQNHDWGAGFMKYTSHWAHLDSFPSKFSHSPSNITSTLLAQVTVILLLSRCKALLSFTLCSYLLKSRLNSSFFSLQIFI